MNQDLLVELGCEELPPKALPSFQSSLTQFFNQELKLLGLGFDAIHVFVTPRRLAIIIRSLADKQADKTIEKLGPFIEKAFDAEGNPTKAALGFAKSNQVAIDSLERKLTDKGERLFFQSVKAGQGTIGLLPELIQRAFQQLPVGKKMRWSDSLHLFARPAQWLVCLYGDALVPCTLFGIQADIFSFGHRFHAPEKLTVNAANYQQKLREAKVIVDFTERKTEIIKQLQAKAIALKAVIPLDEDLLNEVCALVEWPVCLVGQFDSSFLSIPQEILISSMKSHQKYFPVFSNDNKMLAYFVTVANIESTDPNVVIAGNEKVIRPRLADAAFFYDSDLKQPLSHWAKGLSKVVFQHQLGSLADKVARMSQLACFIAEQLKVDVELVKRATALAKADLLTEVVCEFPDLQGTIGQYYARANNEHQAVATAIASHYQPKNAEDQLPADTIGQIVGVADRIDTIVGIFGIGQIPTGNKDPFALRRAALSILKIIIEKRLDLDLDVLFRFSASCYGSLLADHNIQPALNYTFDRLKSYYLEQGIRTEVFLAVADKTVYQPVDFHNRLLALAEFDKTDAADSLASANKRVNNLLKKSTIPVDNSGDIQSALLQNEAEKQLVQSLNDIKQPLTDAAQAANYETYLSLLASLKKPVDNFFEKVLIMDPNETIKTNRLCILNSLKTDFDAVANIALLAKS